MTTILLNGRQLTLWQRCRRHYAIEQQYRYTLWYPTTLFSAVMRRAIVQLSSGMDRERVETEAVSMFVAQARSPGLDAGAGVDTYKLAMDLCATIRAILSFLQRITLTPLKELPVLKRTVGPDVEVEWSALAHRDETGLLHRWVFTPAISADTMITEAHKWETFGDLVVYDAPMMLHVVGIGQTVGGRRHSPWCRAYKSPVIAGQIRFKKRKGQFAESWEPVYYADNQGQNADRWVDAMIEDGAHEGLLLHQTLKQPEKLHVDRFYRDLEKLAREIIGVEPDMEHPLRFPMSRPACDLPYVCPHQILCYGAKSIEETGLYRPRTKDAFFSPVLRVARGTGPA